MLHKGGTASTLELLSASLAQNASHRWKLIGDVNGDKTVDRADVTLTKDQVGIPVTGSNFREDVNVSSTITSGDLNLVKGAVGHKLP